MERVAIRLQQRSVLEAFVAWHDRRCEQAGLQLKAFKVYVCARLRQNAHVYVYICVRAFECE